MVGRDEELTRLTDLADMSVEHGARMVLLSGDAGIGKSTLTAFFLAQLREAGWGTHVGHCIEYADRPLPFGPVVAVLRSLLLDDLERVDHLVGHHREDLAGLVPELGDGDAGSASLAGDVDRLFDAIASLLGRASDGRPIAFLIEDVHWSDAATRDLLTSLVHNLRSARVLMLITERTGALEKGNPLRTWLAEQRRFPNVHSIELEGLAQEDLAAQVTSLTGEEADTSFVADLFQRTGGNPYFAHELVVAHGQRSGELPTSLREFLTSRLSQLGPDEREVLRAVAIAGGSVAHPVLASMLSDLNLGPVIRTLFDAGILQFEDSTYHFSHALLREAILEDVLPFEAEDLHRAAAEALEANLGSKPQLSDLVGLAVHWGSARVEDRAREAGVVAALASSAVAAFDTAADLALQALDWWPAEAAIESVAGVARHELLVKAVDWLALCNKAEMAESVGERAIRSFSTTESGGVMAELLATVSVVKFALAKPDEASAMLTQALERVGDERTPHAARVHHIASSRALMSGDIHGALDAADRTIDLAQDVGPDLALVDALATRALAVGIIDDPDLGVRLCQEARTRATEHGFVAQAARTYRNEMSIIYFREGRTEPCLRTVESGLAYAERHCGPRWRTYLRHDLVLAMLDAGNLPAAAEHLEVLSKSELDDTFELWTTQAWALYWLAVGDLDKAQECAAEADLVAGRYESAQETGVQQRVWAEIRRREGTPELALKLVRDALRLQWESDNLTYTRESLIELARIVGALATKDALEESTLEWATTEVARFAGPGAANACMKGLMDLELDLVRGSQHQTSAQEVVAHLETAGFEYEAMQARLAVLTTMVAEGRQRIDLEPQLQDLYDRARAGGVRWIAARAESLASVARVPIVAGDSPASPSTAAELPHHLTMREIEVMSLLAEGLTNKAIGERLFVSPRTVSTHVSNLLAKVGASNRGEAAAAYLRLGLDDVVDLRESTATA